MADRVHEIKSSLGTDALLLRRMVIKDELGRPFTWEATVISEKPAIKPEDLLGTSLTVSVEPREGAKRFFNGLVSEVCHLGRHSGYAHYRLTLRPWLWFLTRTRNCRIFQTMTVPKIIEKVFKELNNFSDFKNDLTGTYPETDYCVQYRETDFDFVSRLMEQEGIYYFFKHEDGKHTLVMADDYSGHAAIEGESELPYRPPGEAEVDLEHISRWLVTHQVQTGTYVLDDYDFEKPKTDLLAKSTVKRKHALADYEAYDYPGEYLEAKQGERYAKTRIEELQAQYERIEATGDAVGLAAGGLFTLKEFPRQDQNKEHLIVSTETEVVSGEIEQFSGSENRFEVSLVAMDSKQQYRPSRLTPRPIVPGPQSAVVVGKKGEEIWTDKYGRVKVQFPWDREGKSDETSSCWIRVSQAWAGKAWGGIHLPRIGQEVMVEFLEGDPDRPIITGRVYNADQTVPYGLPDNQTQSGIQSRSTKKGDAKTFNELRFEDKKGEEEIYLHAEKNFQRVVENDETVKIGFDTKDPGDQTIEVYNNRSLTVDQGNDEITIKTGDRTINIKAGKSSTTAAVSIELKVGSSSVKIEPAKITLKSTEIAIEADVKAELKATTTDVKGSAMVKLQGGMIKIN